jgi:hypothetical protein
VTSKKEGDQSREKSTRHKSRVPWSEEEIDAVKKGYKQYPNRWTDIKELFPHILKDRTSVQIKVCLIHHYYLQKPFC